MKVLCLSRNQGGKTAYISKPSVRATGSASGPWWRRGLAEGAWSKNPSWRFLSLSLSELGFLGSPSPRRQGFGKRQASEPGPPHECCEPGNILNRGRGRGEPCPCSAQDSNRLLLTPTQQLPGQQLGAPLFGAGCEVRRFPRTVKQRGEGLLGGDGSWGKEKPPHEGQGAVSQRWAGGSCPQ